MAVDETGAQVGKKKNCVRRSGLRLLQSVTCPFRSWHSLSGHNTYFMAFIGISEFIQARTRFGRPLSVSYTHLTLPTKA